MYRNVNISTAHTATRSRALARASGYGLILLMIARLIATAHAQPVSEEYSVKAAFIFHFAQLVDWPDGALNSGLDVCMFDDEPRRKQLQDTLQ